MRVFYLKSHWQEYKDVFTGTFGIGIWPPEGIETFDPLDIPYLNTLILLLSGTTCTWAHHEVREGNMKEAIKALKITVALGVFFSLLQAYEYHHATFDYCEIFMEQHFIWQQAFTGFMLLLELYF